jgi:3-deoxy-D-manno-octulosonate 8-phosphate phosphatase KdsC-like HAD superfamily phosphatase
MALVGWSIAVADAHPTVRAAARLVLQRPGGFGAVRELADLVLASAQNNDVVPLNTPNDRKGSVQPWQLQTAK